MLNKPTRNKRKKMQRNMISNTKITFFLLSSDSLTKWTSRMMPTAMAPSITIIASIIASGTIAVAIVVILDDDRTHRKKDKT